MNIFELPTDCLIEIFTNLPKPTKYSTVCKKFYQVICLLPINHVSAKITEGNMVLTQKFFNNIDYFFGKAIVYDMETDFLTIFGRFIQNVTFTKINRSAAEMNKMLERIPNCTEINIYNYNWDVDKTLQNVLLQLNLRDLKRFSLRINNPEEVAFVEKIMQKYVLDSFSCTFVLMTNEIVDSVLALLPTYQRGIKKLKLTNVNNFFGPNMVLDNLTSLELDIFCKDFNSNTLENFKSLKALALHFNTKFNNKIPFLTSTKISNLKELRLSFKFTYTLDNLFDDLSTPVLNMKDLTFSNVQIKDVKHLERILKTFKQLEKLKIHGGCSKQDTKVNFDNFDWKNCSNLSMKLLHFDFSIQNFSNLTASLKATYPGLTSLKINGTYARYIETPRDVLQHDLMQFQSLLKNFYFRKLMIRCFEKGSKIDCLLATERKITKLLIFFKRWQLTTERFQYLVELMHRQGGNIRELEIRREISCDHFWQLIGLATNCRKLILNNMTFNNIVDYSKDGRTLNSISPGKVEELHIVLNKNVILFANGILSNLVKIYVDLKKLILEFGSSRTSAPLTNEIQYYKNFLSNCNLEYLTWKMNMGFFSQKVETAGFVEEQKTIVTNIISGQKKLKTLKLQFDVWNELFVEIANNCSELEELEFYGAQNLNLESFFAVQHLAELRSLIFAREAMYTRMNSTHLSSFLPGLRGLNLTNLEIFEVDNASEEVFIELAAAVPSLKSFTIEVKNYPRHPCSILQHFIYLEKFIITLHSNIDPADPLYHLYVNPNLKVLFLSFDAISFKLNDIQKILIAFPNIEQLFINMQERSNYRDFASISLNELHKILDVVPELKTVYLGGLQISISDSENIQNCQLKRRFQAIKYYKGWSASELVLSSDKASVEKMLKYTTHTFVLKGALTQL